VVQDLQYLSTSVGLEGMSRVFGQAERITRPSRSADLDHNLRNLRTPGDLPEPTAHVDTPTHMRPEVRSDLPTHHARLLSLGPPIGFRGWALDGGLVLSGQRRAHRLHRPRHEVIQGASHRLGQ